MLEQIDKDVRRTLPDFAFFQLPIPYSPLCPLSTEPEKRKPKKKKVAKKSPISRESSAASMDVKTETEPGIESTVTVRPREPRTPLRQRTLHCTSLDMKWTNETHNSTTSTLKRRQTVTITSPMAGKKSKETYQWPNEVASPLPFDDESATPPLPSSASNGARRASDLNPPAPSKLRVITTTASKIESVPQDPEDEDDEEEEEEEEEEEKNEKSELPDYLFSPIPTRRSLFKRVAHLNQDFGSRQHQPHSLRATRSKDSWKKRQNGNGGEPGDPPLSSSPSEMSSDSDDSNEEELPQDLHWEAIERILFIYAKLNPGVGYVQGMNEILGPLYYLLANDPDEISRAHAEAESFWLFHLLMAHFRDHFVRSLDRDRTSGIGSSIARMNSRLRQFDEQIWQNLEGKGIAPEYYGFRWLTVLCTQEFEMPDVWRIWDSILADTGGVERDYDFLLDFGCAMVCHLRTDLLGGDFADNVKLLQNYPPVDIQVLLQLASVIRDHRVRGTTKRYTLTRDTSKDTGTPRLWSPRTFSSDAVSIKSFSETSDKDLKATTIDGVKNSDRLDHNLEGTDHRSAMYSTPTRPLKKGRPSSISGLSLDGLWLRNNTNTFSSLLTDKRQLSPSSLSVDNFAIGKDVRPTWVDTFTAFKAKIVGLGSSPVPTPTESEAEDVLGTLEVPTTPTTTTTVVGVLDQPTTL
ncbi:hypothetical protein BGX34_003256 [Mortierella sp. NVP85]|nr:hypothetical protein BGX34_003256 [Mortierella sp. NVP85]